MKPTTNPMFAFVLIVLITSVFALTLSLSDDGTNKITGKVSDATKLKEAETSTPPDSNTDSITTTTLKKSFNDYVKGTVDYTKITQQYTKITQQYTDKITSLESRLNLLNNPDYPDSEDDDDSMVDNQDEIKKVEKDLEDTKKELKDIEDRQEILDNIAYNRKETGSWGNSLNFLDLSQYGEGTLVNNILFKSNGYPGIASLFYTSDDMYLSDTMNNWLTGPDGIASEICKNKVSYSEDSGFAFSTSSDGASAHIEGEKITMINYSSKTPSTHYYYRVSFKVDPSSCIMEYNVLFDDSTPIITYEDSDVAYEYDESDSTVSYIGSSMLVLKSEKTYTKVCIKFNKITGNKCLVGLSSGESLCSAIVDGAVTGSDASTTGDVEDGAPDVNPNI